MLVWRGDLQQLASRAVGGGMYGSVGVLISNVSDGGIIAVGVNIRGGQHRGLLLLIDMEGSLKWFKSFDRPVEYVVIARSGERVFARSMTVWLFSMGGATSSSLSIYLPALR